MSGRRDPERGHLARWVGGAYVLALVFFLLLPALAIFPAALGEGELLEFPPARLSLRWFGEVLGDGDWLDSAAFSFVLAAATALLSTVLAVLVGVAQLRYHRLPRGLLPLLLAPLWVPHVAVATGLFSLLLPWGLAGQAWALVLANTVLALPLSATLVLASFSALEGNLWMAAASLGAPPATIVRTVLLPLAATALVSSLLLAFQSAWDETVFALFIGPVDVPTLSVRIYAYVSQSLTPAIAAVAALVAAVSLAGLLFLLLLRRGLAGRRGAGLP